MKIGVDRPVTGPTARIGLDIQKGTKMAIDDAFAASELPITGDGESVTLGCFGSTLNRPLKRRSKLIVAPLRVL